MELDSDEEGVDSCNIQLGITKEKADLLYDGAGELVDEDPEQLTLEKYEHLLCDEVHLVIKEVLSENQIRFKLQDFQMLTLHCLGSLKNVVLICPTGCGKMLCSYLGTLVLRKVFGKVKGVSLGNQPLSALMEEKLKTPVIKTGLISMKGDLRISSEGPGEAVLTDCIDKFKNGTIVVIIGHPESWLTDTAKDIIETLRKEERIVFSFLDEFQMNLSSFWGKDFRYVKLKNDGNGYDLEKKKFEGVFSSSISSSVTSYSPVFWSLTLSYFLAKYIFSVNIFFGKHFFL